MRTQAEVIEELKLFEPDQDGNWSEFIKLLDELWTLKNPQKAYRTLFELLVKYDDNYMECQWAIVHGMEHFGEYESDLIDSLTKKPVDLTLTMVSRMINSGRKTIASISIDLILDQILDRSDNKDYLKEFALDCKDRLSKSTASK